MSHLERGNETTEPSFSLEYLTFRLSVIRGSNSSDMPIPIGQLPRSVWNSTTKESRYTPYEMEDLTIRSWVELGRRIGKNKNKKLRKRFKEIMYFIT